MLTKEIVKEIKAQPNGKARFKEIFNRLYSQAGFPLGNDFSEVVLKAIKEVCPYLTIDKLNNNTANSVAEKLDR